MLDSLPVTPIVGTLLGFLSGLGIGGGSLLIIWLTVVLHADPMTARSINLLFFIPSALVACFIRFRRDTLQLRHVLPAALSGCIAAALFSVLAANADTALLKKLFGGLLIAAGLRELFYRPRNAR